MEFDVAAEQLRFHCGTHPDTDDPRWAAGFLQSLRPYSGRLNQDAMERVLECVDAVADHLRTSPTLDRSVINSLWGIVTYTHAWALHPDGMLQSNNLITKADSAVLSNWIDDISRRVALMLDSGYDPKTVASSVTG